MVFLFLPRAASVKVILFRLCMDVSKAPSTLFSGCYLPPLFKSDDFTLWGACDDSSGCRLVVCSDLTSCSSISVRAEDRKKSSENIYQFI